MAGIYSNIPLYAEWVEQGRTGMLVENTEAAWYAAMKYLVENPEVARRIGDEARAVAEKRFSMERYANAWLTEILEPLVTR